MPCIRLAFAFYERHESRAIPTRGIDRGTAAVDVEICRHAETEVDQAVGAGGVGYGQRLDEYVTVPDTRLVLVRLRG
jgi:hypothetical protein